MTKLGKLVTFISDNKNTKITKTFSFSLSSIAVLEYATDWLYGKIVCL